MDGPAFTMKVITPIQVVEKKIGYIRLKDKTGFFGVMKGHEDFMTALVSSLGYYTDAGGRERFIAVDSGIFSVREGVATLLSKEIFESEDAEKLAKTIEYAFSKREESEKAFFVMIEGIEKSFIRKTAEYIRGKA